MFWKNISLNGSTKNIDSLIQEDNEENVCDSNYNSTMSREATETKTEILSEVLLKDSDSQFQINQILQIKDGVIELNEQNFTENSGTDLNDKSLISGSRLSSEFQTENSQEKVNLDDYDYCNFNNSPNFSIHEPSSSNVNSDFTVKTFIPKNWEKLNVKKTFVYSSKLYKTTLISVNLNVHTEKTCVKKNCRK